MVLKKTWLQIDGRGWVVGRWSMKMAAELFLGESCHFIQKSMKPQVYTLDRPWARRPGVVT